MEEASYFSNTFLHLCAWPLPFIKINWIIWTQISYSVSKTFICTVGRMKSSVFLYTHNYIIFFNSWINTMSQYFSVTMSLNIMSCETSVNGLKNESGLILWKQQHHNRNRILQISFYIYTLPFTEKPFKYNTWGNKDVF